MPQDFNCEHFLLLTNIIFPLWINMVWILYQYFKSGRGINTIFRHLFCDAKKKKTILLELVKEIKRKSKSQSSWNITSYEIEKSKLLSASSHENFSKVLSFVSLLLSWHISNMVTHQLCMNGPPSKKMCALWDADYIPGTMKRCYAISRLTVWDANLIVYIIAYYFCYLCGI